ncbi:MAG: hypothetical protein ACRDRX_04125 [Pseudonocardiaceae bacterium]
MTARPTSPVVCVHEMGIRFRCQSDEVLTQVAIGIELIDPPQTT